ncbi:MAG TPA: SurA N-terminal domain-containing protein [Chthoniobacterales bacterium]
MRKHHKVLMIIITVLVCISFSWYWNKTDFAQMGTGTVGKIYDRNVSQVELQRNMRLLRLASQLGMRDLLTELTAGAQTETEAFEKFSWNLMVLRHEAEQMGIQPNTNEIANTIKALPVFQNENGFDASRYTTFVDQALAPMGFNESQVEELAADQIMVQRLKKILSAGSDVPEAEMRTSFDQAYSKMDVSVIKFRSEDFAKDVTVSDDEISKYYEAQKAQLKSDEKRKVKFVEFALTDEQKKLTGKQRIDVLQKLADRANDFTEALQAKGADFDQAVAKFKLTPKETGDFSRESPDPMLAGNPTLVAAAFNLTKDAPNSDAVQTQDGFDVVHLLQIDPSRPLTLEEAKPKIVETLKKRQVVQALAKKAGEIVGKLREELKSGKPLAEAATAEGVTLEKMPAFTLAEGPPPGASPAPSPEPKKDENPEIPYVKRAAGDLSVGQVSDFVSTPQGGVIVVLDKRETLDPSVFEKARPILESRALENQSQMVFYEWLRERRHVAGVPETKAPAATG